MQLHAYSQESLRLSLQDAIALGLKNHPGLQSQQLNIQLVQNSIARNRSQYLPLIEASADLRYNTRLPATVLPEGFFGTGSGPQLIRFGTTYNSVLAVNATQNIFDATLAQDIKIARKSVEIEQEILNQVKSELKQTVTEAYYTALLREQEVIIATKTVSRLRSYLEVKLAKLELGTVQENEVNTVKLDYQNADLSLKKSKQNLQQSLQKLANTLYLEVTQPIELSDSLFNDDLNSGLQAELSQLAENRSEIKQVSLDNEITGLRFKKVANSILPSVAAYANYSTQYQSNQFDLLGKSVWTPFNYIGLQLNVPIFNRNTARLEKQEYRLQQQINRNTLRQRKREITDELQTVRTELLNAGLNYQYAQENYKLAESIYEVNLKKYELGSLLYTDLLDIEESLVVAEKNLLTQMYDLLIAKARWQKAKGE